ncbi:MAG: RDD family protein, partial [Povalibacter sp.]
NPYEPPHARVEDASLIAAPIPKSAEELRYAGFWRRFGAYWVDFVALLPLALIAYFVTNAGRLFYIAWFIPGLLIQLFFHVYLVKRYGGTPGKLVLKTRIAMLDGSPVTAKAAALRYVVLFILAGLVGVGLCMGAMSMTEETYLSLGYVARSQKLMEIAPSWVHPLTLLMSGWVWSEFISMLFNDKRRAIHDFIAGTVVVESQAS